MRSMIMAVKMLIKPISAAPTALGRLFADESERATRHGGDAPQESHHAAERTGRKSGDRAPLRLSLVMETNGSALPSMSSSTG